VTARSAEDVQRSSCFTRELAACRQQIAELLTPYDPIELLTWLFLIAALVRNRPDGSDALELTGPQPESALERLGAAIEADDSLFRNPGYKDQGTALLGDSSPPTRSSTVTSKPTSGSQDTRLWRYGKRPRNFWSPTMPARGTVSKQRSG
jgi:hypothetical protein